SAPVAVLWAPVLLLKSASTPPAGLLSSVGFMPRASAPLAVSGEGRVRGRGGGIGKTCRILLLWPPFWSGFTPTPPYALVVCAIEPDGGTHAAGGYCVDRHGSRSGRYRLHGLVWPAWSGLDCSRACLPEAGTELAGRVHHTACGDSNRAA